MSRQFKEKKHDKAVGMTFPTSDPMAQRKPTGTEAPARPTDCKAPVITREQIEQRGVAKVTSINRRNE